MRRLEVHKRGITAIYVTLESPDGDVFGIFKERETQEVGIELSLEDAEQLRDKLIEALKP